MVLLWKYNFEGCQQAGDWEDHELRQQIEFLFNRFDVKFQLLPPLHLHPDFRNSSESCCIQVICCWRVYLGRTHHRVFIIFFNWLLSDMNYVWYCVYVFEYICLNNRNMCNKCGKCTVHQFLNSKKGPGPNQSCK